VFGRNWAGEANCRIGTGRPPRLSTKASRFEGFGSELQSPITRIRQVEQPSGDRQQTAGVRDVYCAGLAFEHAQAFRARETVLPLPVRQI